MLVDKRNSPGRHQLPPPSGVRLAINEFADSTSMHGVPHIINARSFTARVIWLIIVTGAFIMFFWQCGILLQRFYEFPKKVIVEIVQKPLPFPAVSICNSDHLDLEVVEHIERQFNNRSVHEKKPHYNASRERQIMDFVRDYQHFQEYSVYFLALNSMREDLGPPVSNIDYLSRIGLTANLGHAQSTNAGIRLQDFIIACRFMRNVDCTQLDVFKPFFDAYYFNCFTFDASSMFKSSTTRMFGLENGLTLMLFVDSAGHVRADGIEGELGLMLPGTQESDLTLASGRGVRVIVHTPGTIAHPMVEGFDIPPGYSVTLAVKGRENVRMSPPYGNCSEKLQGLSSGINYTLVDCQNMCIQRRIMDECGCVDSRLGTPADVSFTRGLPFCNQLPRDLHKLTPSGEPCDLRDVLSIPTCKLNKTEVTQRVWAWRNMTQCYQDVYNNYTIGDPNLIETCQCYPPCHDFVYDVSYSLSAMPENTGEHAEFYGKIEGFLKNLPEEKQAILNASYGGNYSQNPQALTSRLTVYIADSNILKTTEKEDYEQTRLLSDIGGQLGLWIGISVITLFEVLMLGVNIFRYCTSGAGGGRERRAGGVGGTSSGEDGHNNSPARIPLRCTANPDLADVRTCPTGAFPNHAAADMANRYGCPNMFDSRFPTAYTKDHTGGEGTRYEFDILTSV